MNFTGFRDFVLVETSAVDYGRGMDELQRLSNNHLMLVHQRPRSVALSKWRRNSSRQVDEFF